MCMPINVRTEKTTTNGRTHRLMQLKLLNIQFVDRIEIDQIFNINNIEKILYRR